MSRLSFAAVALGGLLLAHGASGENVLRWASQGDALTYDPHAQNEGPTNTANLQVYEPLVMRTPTMTKTPGLATSWSLVEPEVWEFQLRQGVKFHDGADLTAEDVVFTFERVRAETSDHKGYVSSVASVEAVDDYTVHIKTDGPNPILPDQLTQIGIMDKGWAEKHDVTTPQDFAGGEETFATRNANGTGPFKLVRRDPGVRTELAKNPDWWGLEDNPHNVDRVVYTPIANPATRVAALLSGELDYVLDPPLQDLRRLEASPQLQVKTVNQIRTIFFGLDQGREELRSSSVKGKNPFADPKVRQAMYQAMNVEAIQQKVMRGQSIPAGIITSPGVHGHSDALDERYPFDPEQGKALLAEAGYPDGFDVTLDCPNDRYNNDEAICQAVVGMLGRIGVQVNLNAQSKSLHFPKIQNRETDFYLLGWGVPTLDSHYVFNFLVHTEGSWNATGYSDPEVDQLIEAIEVETDLAKRDQMIEQTWQTVKDAFVYLPVHHQVIAWAMVDDLELPIAPDDSPYFRWARFSR